MNGPVPVGWAVEYSLVLGSFPASSWNSSSAAGLCIENAGSDSAEMKPGNGALSWMVAVSSSSAEHDS